MRLILLIFFWSLFPTKLLSTNDQLPPTTYHLPPTTYWQQKVHYQIDASLDDSSEVITGKLRLTYTNNSPNTLNEAFFHLYQNSNQPGSLTDKLYELNKIKPTYGNYEKQGLGTQITWIQIEGNKSTKPYKKVILDPQIDYTIMKIDLPEPLQSGDSCVFEIWFKTYFDRGSIRRRMKVFDHHGVKHFNGVHWYPRICVYDRKFTWETSQHLEKEFYGDFGTFDVKLNLPEKYIVEATGLLINREEALPDDLRKAIDINQPDPRSTSPETQNPKPNYQLPPTKDQLPPTKTWHFLAQNVHDFAWTADPTYRISEVTWNGIQCVAIAQAHNAKNWTKTAQYLSEVIAFYSRNFGMYAYPKIVVADAADGMEYPMLTLCGGSYPSHRSLIAHEVAHNWFMGMVGSNETYRAALDEGFTQFLTAEALKELKVEPFPEYSRAIGPYLDDAIDGEDERLNTHSNEFHEAVGQGGGYGNVYFKTATMLYNLRYFLGDSIFSIAMKNYVEQWKFKHPYIEDFRNSVIQSAQIDLNKFFDQWFESKEVIDYGIKKVKKLENGQYKITVRRYGNLTMPVNLDLLTRTESGKLIFTQLTIPTNQYIIPNRLSTKVWNSWGRLNRDFTVNVSIEPKHELTEIFLDATYLLADIDRRNNRWKKKISFKLDQGQGPNTNILEPYEILIRPAYAYNQFSGSIAGAKFSGQYANRKHVFDARIYYAFHNQIYSLSTVKYDQQNVLGFVKWSHTLRGGGTYFAEIIGANQRLSSLFGWKWKVGNQTFGLYGKHLQSINKNAETILNPNILFNGYLPTSKIWSDNTNTNFHVYWNLNYSGWNQSGSFLLDTRLISPWSETQFGWINGEWKHQIPWKSTTFKSRIFAQLGYGTNPSPESVLYASSANPEMQFQNMFIRNMGNVRPEFTHFGGGLNLRGYQGRAIGIHSNDSIMAFFRGTSGLSWNAEWHFGKVLSPFLKNKFISLSPYLFADAGVMAFEKLKTWYYSGLLTDAGIGTWIDFNNYNKILNRRNTYNPKTVRFRFDLPIFLNTVNYNEKFVDFRFIIGVEAAF